MSNYDTLVLNRLYLPIHVIDWKRSINLVYQDIAHSLDIDFIPYNWDNWMEFTQTPKCDMGNYRIVHSVNKRIAVPDIIVLQHYDRLPKRDIKFTRESVIQRDNYICAYCGKKFKKDYLTIDHILPKSLGGKNTWKNTVASCKACNNRKADRTPEQAKMPLLYQPKEPRWQGAFHKMINHINIRPSWHKFLESIDVKI